MRSADWLAFARRYMNCLLRDGVMCGFDSLPLSFHNLVWNVAQSQETGGHSGLIV